jgi:hypothetical protein
VIVVVTNASTLRFRKLVTPVRSTFIRTFSVQRHPAASAQRRASECAAAGGPSARIPTQRLSFAKDLGDNGAEITDVRCEVTRLKKDNSAIQDGGTARGDAG